MFFTGKTYSTRDGRMARIYALDGGGINPIQGAIFDGHIWRSERWFVDGRYQEKSTGPYDLDGLWEDRPKRLVAWICKTETITLGHLEFRNEDWVPDAGIGHVWERAEWLDKPTDRKQDTHSMLGGGGGSLGPAGSGGASGTLR